MKNRIPFYLFFVFLILAACKDANTTNVEENESQNTSETTDAEDQNATSNSILFFGDSLTAGYGLDDPDNAFPGLIQEKLDSLGLDYNVINAGLSGETTAGGRNRLEWVLEPDVAIFVLELGANDGLRGVSVAETRENLQWMIDKVKDEAPQAKIVLAGMQLPPNLGTEYTTDFKNMFPQLAEENNIAFIPFLLQNVGGIASLNQNDGIHPTEEGHKLVAANVWPVLKPLVQE
ncbi:arylesterase [Leeuwenhoekiella palythoae]|uniref:arylesterase n=1 Tax=Leeuwenhoekiella palythoae TaxID=573501 RepID=UPI003514DF5E